MHVFVAAPNRDGGGLFRECPPLAAHGSLLLYFAPWATPIPVLDTWAARRVDRAAKWSQVVRKPQSVIEVAAPVRLALAFFNQRLRDGCQTVFAVPSLT